MTRCALASFLLSHVVPSPGHLAGPATVLGWAMDPGPGVWVRAAQLGFAVSLSLLGYVVSLSLPRMCRVTVQGVQCQCHCLKYAVLLSLPRTCSVSVTAQDVQCHCHRCCHRICSLAAPAATSPSDTKEQRLLCKALPHPLLPPPQDRGHQSPS